MPLPQRPPPARILARRTRVLALLLVGALLAPPAVARDYANDAAPGIEEKLGQRVPLDATFRDETGRTVRLSDLVVRPMVLALVYFRCPTICSPLLHELASMVQKVDLVPGIDYDLMTISFDVDEDPELARLAKENLLGGMKKRVPPEAWHFLTGDRENIVRLTDAVGFRFRRDRQDFVHAAAVVFLAKDGKIVRYLGGLQMLPADLKLAILDAAEGHPRTLMQRIQQLCYAYDPQGKTYVLQVNRIVLFVTLGFLGLFLLYLFWKRRRGRGVRAAAPAQERPAR